MDFQSEHIPISLSFSQLLTAVKQLSPEEKYILGSELWSESDDLDDNLYVSESEQKMILARAEEMDNNPNASTTWADVQAKLKAKYDF